MQMKPTSMKNKARILLLGADSDDIRTLDASLRGQVWFSVSTATRDDDATPNWAAVHESRPDVVILSIGNNWKASLDSLPSKRVAGWEWVVMGPSDNMLAMRHAMQLGARDYIPLPTPAAEVVEIVRRVVRDHQPSNPARQGGQITTVMNSKGGSGASFMAANIAHMLCSERQMHVGLLDLDLQFGTQSLNFDVSLAYGVVDVLRLIKQLDAVALQGYLSKHRSGLMLLGEKLDEIVLPGDVNPEAVDLLLDLVIQGFDHTVIDLPRQVDPTFSTLVAKSNQFVISTQQSVPHIRDTKRLLRILHDEFQFSSDRIFVVINRYSEKSGVTIDEIARTLDHDRLFTLQNDFKRAASAIDTATPLADLAPNAPLTNELRRLTQRLLGEEIDQPSLLKRAFGGIFGG